ncbi:MAG: hypothetical protein WAU29_10680 [Chitinophagaceae bacterium]
MNINYHNYEECFILYMDNELSGDERRMVEAFVQQHPELKEELDLLLQYKLTPDTSVVYSGKEDLMKETPPTGQAGSDVNINLSNYEEWLVLHLDNELTPGQKATVEKFLAANPAVQQEFVLLQRTQLQPETIIFADKASLYRKEEKVRPVAVRWWRLAAAAILLLGVGITVALFVNKKSDGGEEIVKETSREKKIDTDNPVIAPEESNNTVNENIVADNNTDVTIPVVTERNDSKAIAKEKNNVMKNQSPVIITPQVIKEEPAVIANNNQPTNNLPQPLNNPNINKNDAVNNAIANNSVPKEIIKQQAPLTNSVVTTQNPQSSDIVNASFTDDAVFDQPADKKNKSRGFFRKVARTFEKRTNIDPTDDNRLLVAGLAIKLK